MRDLVRITDLYNITGLLGLIANDLRQWLKKDGVSRGYFSHCSDRLPRLLAQVLLSGMKFVDYPPFLCSLSACRMLLLDLMVQSNYLTLQYILNMISHLILQHRSALKDNSDYVHGQGNCKSKPTNQNCLNGDGVL